MDPQSAQSAPKRGDDMRQIKVTQGNRFIVHLRPS